jgi:hypothetical protein
VIGSVARCYRMALSLDAETVATAARCSLSDLARFEDETVPHPPGSGSGPMRVAGALGLAIESRVRLALAAGQHWSALCAGRTGAIPAAEWRAAAEGLGLLGNDNEAIRESA